MIAYKAPLPREKIKKVLETQILPKFTSGFVQATEAEGPDGRSLDQWLSELTADMQLSIERHLSRVFRSEGGSGA